MGRPFSKPESVENAKHKAAKKANLTKHIDMMNQLSAIKNSLLDQKEE